jgi:hypothetical protein
LLHWLGGEIEAAFRKMGYKVRKGRFFGGIWGFFSDKKEGGGGAFSQIEKVFCLKLCSIEPEEKMVWTLEEL